MLQREGQLKNININLTSTAEESNQKYKMHVLTSGNSAAGEANYHVIKLK